jgi:tetratricopeptide (TPR) repeat protein
LVLPIFAQQSTFHFGLLTGQPTYSSFIKGKKLLTARALHLPQSNYWLAFIVLERSEEQDLWSPDKADRTTAKIFVYDMVNRGIDEKLTDYVNIQLGADKYYAPNFCGGLGSLAEKDYKIVGNKITLTQFYAPATERSNCATEIVFKNGQILIQKLGVEDTGLETSTGKERSLLNQKALALLKAGKIQEAILIWEDLYGQWLHSAFPKAGNPDEMLNNLGFAYWKLKMYVEAEKILLECKKNFPQRKAVYINLADVYRDMKKKKEAIAYYQQFINLEVSEQQKRYATTELEKLKK